MHLDEIFYKFFSKKIWVDKKKAQKNCLFLTLKLISKFFVFLNFRTIIDNSTKVQKKFLRFLIKRKKRYEKTTEKSKNLIYDDM